MPQSLSKLGVHLVFSTKGRARVFPTPELRADLCAYLAGILRNQGCPCIQAGAVQDHVHILYLQSRTKSVADVVGAVKRDSSAWIKTQDCERKDPALMKFHWQDGYGVFAVSESKIEAVKAYIDNQEEHHKRVSFQDEYRSFLQKHGVEFDERYVWD
jgi:putative transposase